MTINATELTPEQELDDAFNEFAGGDSATADDSGDDRLRDEQGRFTAEQDEGGELDDEQGEDLPEAAELDQSEAVNDSPADLLKKAQDEAQQWQHRYNSDLGRQNALQNKIKEQQDLIQKLQASPSAGGNPDGSGIDDATWKALKEDFPEIASALEAKSAADARRYEQQFNELKAQFQPIQAQAQDQYVAAQYQILEQRHPDWKDVSASPDFTNWVGSQPPAIQQLMDSKNAADAAYLIDTFKLTNAPASQPKDELRAKRSRQLQSSQSIPSRSARRTAVAEDDLDAAFDYYASRA